MKRLLSAIAACLVLWGCQKSEPPPQSVFAHAEAEKMVDRLFD
jgi:PBP1b-binding outer membrane lipoprotein LpoB